MHAGNIFCCRFFYVYNRTNSRVMILLISPAKSLKEEPNMRPTYSLPRYKKETFELVKALRRYREDDLMAMMNISGKLATENIKRYKSFRKEHNRENSLIAIDTFNGDVYQGLMASTWNTQEMSFAQDHLRILSGLYGVLRPLDLMHPYRLEMGTRLKTDNGSNIYQFWDDKITKTINKELKSLGSDIVINLASNEYFKVIKKDKLEGRIITINFKEWRDGSLKFISFNAKKARGMMARYIIQNQITEPDDIKGFDTGNYAFDEANSSENEWLFVR